ncbi:hypothetical protein A7E78_03970 [Syntrophotalea acetylenivorans]|uniref:PBP domain-containing protein n=1 Tax=Syntrophotalea acetylenivorans TaxID=1842532 RepID=A0A1L3GMA4_9BACT|nr:substrate-binding domain-containing protein [Syntrophotalea acetylenivorans]APG27063.1 hypothetical protein A7E78_03970 [Syntrophotalea acetylenivorans]
MKAVSIFVVVIIFFSLSGLVFGDDDEPLLIPGTGDSQFLLHTLADVFNGTGAGFRVIIPNSIGSTGGIRSLLAGDISLARTARPLNDKERGMGGVEFQFANSPVAVVTNPSVKEIDNLTSAQFADIYAGRYRRWSELGGRTQKFIP